VELLGRWKSWLAVLEMQQPNPLSKSLQHRNWILARLRDPVAVHFEADQFGIGARDQRLKARGLSESPEFIIVIVESEAHAHAFRALSPFVEVLGGAGEAVH